MDIKIQVLNQKAKIINRHELYSGTVAIEGIQFEFSDEWADMTKTATVYVGAYDRDKAVNILIENDRVAPIQLPPELFEKNCELYVGVFAIDADGRRLTSSIVRQEVKKGVPVQNSSDNVSIDVYTRIIQLMTQAKDIAANSDEKIESNKKYVEQAKECLKQIDTRTEQATTQITEVTNAKLTDLANTTNAKLEDINNTALSQIEAINSSAAAAGESQIKGINTVASNQISSITNVTGQQLNNINATVTHQIGIIEDKTSTQIESINNTATSQISAINSTALSQIKSINNVAQEMNLHYSEMCRNLGIDHNGIVFAETTRERPSTMYSIDVSNFKYIKFAKVVIGDFIEVTLPAEGICSIWITNLEAVETNVISDKEYDVSLISELKYYVAYPGSGHKAIVNYSLYNDEDGINGVTDLIVENALGGDY